MLNLYIKNIGTLNEVNIDIEGLTIVGARNDSGKSTISKVIGTSLLSLNKYQDTFKDYLEERIKRLLYSIHNTMENNLKNKKVYTQDVPKAVKDYIDYDGEIDLYTILSTFDMTFRIPLYERLDRAIKSYRLIIDNFNRYFTSKDLIRLNNLINDLENVKNVKIEEVTTQLILEFFRETFPHNLVNFHYNKDARILLKDNDNKILDFIIDNNNRAIKCSIGNSSIKNIAYIESPQIIDSLNSYEETFSEKFLGKNPKLKFYGNQLEKMLTTRRKSNLVFDDERNLQIKKLLNKIEKIIRGEMIFDEQGNREFVFQKGSYKIDTSNVATGIKTFSIIQILIKNNWLNEETILIIDEPEINLHPEWQVKYAEILVLIQKYLNVKLYINTHSSYMIEAFDLYSKYYDINKYTNFYILENYKTRKMKKSLNPIFEQLNGAFNILDDIKIKEFLED